MVPVRGYTTLAAGRGFGLLPPLPRGLLVVPFLPVDQCGTWYTILYRSSFLPVNQCGTWYAIVV